MAERKRKPTTRNTAKAATAGTTIRLEQPKSKRGQKQPTVKVVVAQELNPVGGFVNFLREHAVVGLAVGFAIATQAQGVIKSLTENFITPVYGLLFNTKNLASQTVTVHFRNQVADIHWGAVVTTIINFLFVLLAIYIIVKSLKLDKLDKKKD